MEQRGWPRRLDDRVDRLLKRRFGFGLVGEPEPTLRKQLLMALVVSSVVALVLLIAMVLSNQTDRAATLLGPVIGVTLGTLLGRVILDHRRRTQARR